MIKKKANPSTNFNSNILRADVLAVNLSKKNVNKYVNKYVHKNKELTSSKVEIYRKNIDLIDKQLIKLLKQRSIEVTMVQKIKAASKQSSKDLNRENLILNKIKKSVKNQNQQAYIIQIYVCILKQVKKLSSNKT